MSFILDALRKSEHERQRNRAPGLAEMRTNAGNSKRGLWLPLAAILAGINLSLLALLWYTNMSDDRSVAGNDTGQSAAQLNRNVPPSWADTARDDRALSDELESQPARFASIAPGAASAITGVGTTSQTPVIGGTTNDVSSATVAPVMPTVTEGIMNGTLNIQPLHLDIHVYSRKPAERFVYINNTRYTEGERVGEQLRVKAIREQGVILDHQGRDYLLTRDE